MSATTRYRYAGPTRSARPPSTYRESSGASVFARACPHFLSLFALLAKIHSVLPLHHRRSLSDRLSPSRPERVAQPGQGDAQDETGAGQGKDDGYDRADDERHGGPMRG